SKEPPIRRRDERIDLTQRRVSINKSSVQPRHEAHSFVDLLRLESQAESQLARMECLEADGGIDVLHQDGPWVFGRNFFNLHSARCRSHKHWTRRRPIHHNTQVKLAFDGKCLFNQQALDYFAFRTSLMRDQPHPENFVDPLPCLSKIFGYLDAATL